MFAGRLTLSKRALLPECARGASFGYLWVQALFLVAKSFFLALVLFLMFLLFF